MVIEIDVQKTFTGAFIRVTNNLLCHQVKVRTNWEVKNKTGDMKIQ